MIIEYLIKGLTDKELKVMRMRLGVANEKYNTLKEIGKELGVTQERIRQIEDKANEKVRCANRIGNIDISEKQDKLE